MKNKQKIILMLKEAIRLLEEEEDDPTVFDEMDKTIADFFGKWIHGNREDVE